MRDVMGGWGERQQSGCIAAVGSSSHSQQTAVHGALDVEVADYIAFGGTQIPLIAEHHLRTLHPARLRDYAHLLHRAIGHERIAHPTPMADSDLIHWVLGVQRNHLEPLRASPSTGGRGGGAAGLGNYGVAGAVYQAPPQERAPDWSPSPVACPPLPHDSASDTNSAMNARTGKDPIADVMWAK